MKKGYYPNIYIYPDGLSGIIPLKEERDEMERREVLEAAKKIKSYCKKQIYDYCIFDGVICLLDERIEPRDWALEEE